jgi:PBP1b-binding outer membrane lipoprotein LpoB
LIRKFAPVTIGLAILLGGCASEPPPVNGDNPAAANVQKSDDAAFSGRAAQKEAAMSGMATPQGGNAGLRSR